MIKSVEEESAQRPIRPAEDGSRGRFILIDHSIKGFGGHHYEYAVHVLQAARDLGFEPVLVVNRAFQSEPGSEAPWR
ncbi:MAG: hypothetical protein ACE5EC_06905, partial [Phycisphaerae bacterium]